MNVCLGRRGCANGIDYDDLAGRFRQPVLMGMRRRGMRIGSPHDDARRILGRARIEALERGSVHVSQCDVAGHVADGVRGHLGGTEPIEEAHRRNARKQGDGPGVVRVQDRPRSMRIHDRSEAVGNLGDRAVPAHGLETRIVLVADPGPLAAGLGPHALQGPRQTPARVAPFPVVGGRTLAAERNPG